MNYWLVKSEPDVYSFAHLQKEKKTVWDGIRNYQARNNLRLMEVGDEVLFYHSVSEKAVVGVARVIKTAYADPKDGTWSVVELEALYPLKKPITLEEVKIIPELKDMKLLSHSRLSVQPVTAQEFTTICALGGRY